MVLILSVKLLVFRRKELQSSLDWFLIRICVLIHLSFCQLFELCGCNHLPFSETDSCNLILVAFLTDSDVGVRNSLIHKSLVVLSLLSRLKDLKSSLGASEFLIRLRGTRRNSYGGGLDISESLW